MQENSQGNCNLFVVKELTPIAQINKNNRKINMEMYLQHKEQAMKLCINSVYYHILDSLVIGLIAIVPPSPRLIISGAIHLIGTGSLLESK